MCILAHMTINKRQLDRLSPEERIKKLRQLKSAKAKEVSELDTLIKQSTEELKTTKLAEEIAPEQKPVDISSLFEATGQNLEAAASEPGIQANAAYQRIVQLYHDYSQLKSLYGAVSNQSARHNCPGCRKRSGHDQ